MLRDEMAKTGGFLFRWRSFLPLVLLPAALVAMVNSGHPFESMEGFAEEAWNGFSLLVSFLGLFFRAFIVGYSAPDTSGRNTVVQRAASLNVSGAYSLMRHPLYFGNFLAWLGLVLFTQSWAFLAVFVLGYVVYYERIMMAEERFLHEKFGDAYEVWATKTSAFLPNFSHYMKPERAFSWKKVLRKEYPGFLGIVICSTLIELLMEYLEHGVFEFEMGWRIYLATGVVTAFGLRVVKKHTRLLVETEAV